MSAFGRIHFLRRQRRFALGEFPSPSIGCFEDFESQTLNFGGPERGWAGPGVVYSYAALVSFENFETSTLDSTILPDFGWAAGGTATLPSFTTNPTTVSAPPGVTVSFTVVVINGASPLAYQWRKNGVNMSNGGVVSGATTATLTLTGIGAGDLANYDCVVTDALSRSATSSTAALTDLVADWVARVIAAGGATPSGGTQTALTTFANGLVTDGLFASMKGLCCFVPDSLIASITPLIKGTGSSPWTNHGPFVSGDLTVAGLKGDGTSKYLDTGLVDTVAFAAGGVGSAGITAYITVDATETSPFGLLSSDSASGLLFYGHYVDGKTYGFVYDSIGLSLASPGTGFYCVSRTSTTSLNIYYATSGTAFSSVASSATATNHSLQGTSIACLGQLGPATLFSAKRTSFCAVHLGLTSTQAHNLYDRVQTLRTTLGGGFI